MSLVQEHKKTEKTSRFKSINNRLRNNNATLKSRHINLQAHLQALQEQLGEAHAKIRWLEEQIILSKHRRFCKQSETSGALQLSLFDDNEADEITETVKPIDDKREEVTYSRKKRKGSQRNIDTSKLPRERLVFDLSAEEKQCSCGCEMQKIGEDTSEKIDYIPAQLKVIEQVTLKYACRACERIQTAQKPNSFMPKSMATTHFVVDVILKKYDEHLPLYRQSKTFARDGIAIPDNTLGNWVMGAAEALAPLGEALWKQVSATNYLQADETPVKILRPDQKGYMWVYQGLDAENRFVVFEFDLTRAAKVPQQRLLDFSGILQTDGYSGYTAIGKQVHITHLGCWDHSRRKFVNAIKINSQHTTGVAGQCLNLINRLYKVERTIKSLPDDLRYQERQERSKPLLDALFCKVHKINSLPKSTLGSAITYLKNNEAPLRRYIEYGNTHISNCLTENIIRPFALGRKNWMFVGNEISANKSALLYSLIQTCKINTIDVRQYLTYVLNKAQLMRRGEIDITSLLPQFINPDIFLE